MNITTKALLSAHHATNTNIINRTGNANFQANSKGSKSSIQFRADKLTISSNGIKKSNKTLSTKKLSPQLNALYKQKENLLKQKNNFISKLLKQESDPDSINENLKEIDIMLKDIENQISKLQFEEQQKSLGLDKDSKKEKAESSSDNKNNTTNDKNSILTDTMNTIVSADCNFEQVESLNAVKADTTRKLKELQCEIKLDEARSLQGKAPDLKYKQREQLEEQISKITKQISEKITSTNEKLSENENNKPTKEANSDNSVQIKDSKDSESKKTDDTIDNQTYTSEDTDKEDEEKKK